MKKQYKILLMTVLIAITAFIVLCFIPIGISKYIPEVEAQIEKELGVTVHIDKLVLRIGPLAKVKAANMSLMYKNGERFGQFNDIKFFVTWSSFFNKKPNVKFIKAKSCELRTDIYNPYTQDLINLVSQKDGNTIPYISIKDTLLELKNTKRNDIYLLKGSDFVMHKTVGYNNFNISSRGIVDINNRRHLNYDISVASNYDYEKYDKNFDIVAIINKIKELDFYTDLVVDLKLSKNSSNNMQASGFINIDNISVLDKDRKSPKSFIYLTLWGDKASVLSNIYTANGKKIYIDGMINNSQKPVLDLKVKTDEIKLKDLYEKLQILSILTNKKTVDDIDGSFIANFTLKGDLKKIKSSGFLRISDALVKMNGINISKIYSDIDFSNNSVHILDAHGYVKDSPITVKGVISDEVDLECLMNEVQLNNLFPKEYGIKNGVLTAKINFSGKRKDIIHKEDILLKGLKAEHLNEKLQIDLIKMNTAKSNIAYLNNVLISTKNTSTIKIPTLKLLVKGNTISIPDTNLFMPNSKLVLSGEINNFNNKLIDYKTKLNGNINSRDINVLSSIKTKFPVEIKLNGNSQAHNIKAQVGLEDSYIFNEPSLINLNGKIEKNIFKIDDLSLNSFNGTFPKEFKQNAKNFKKISVNGIIENSETPILKNIRVIIPQPLNCTFNDVMLQLKGDLFLNGSIKKPSAVGQINIQNLINQQMMLFVQNCILDFNNDNISINAPQVKISDSAMGLNANVASDFSNGLLVKNINIKSKYINTDTLLMYKDVPCMQLPLTINEGKFYSERVNATLYNTPLYLSLLSMDFSLKNNILNIKNLISEMYNGKLSANITYNMHDESIISSLMARNVSSAPIFNMLVPMKDSVSGSMDFDSNLSGTLSSKDSLNGNVKFWVHNGRMSTLGKLEHLLYAQNVISDNMLRTSLSVVIKAVSLKDTGLFKYLRGDIDLSNGIAHIKMMQSQGPLMSLFIKGDYNTLNNYAKLTILGRLSDEIVSGLGAFGELSISKLLVILSGEDTQNNITVEDIHNLPQLPMKNTKEFRSVINGSVDKSSSVILFNWISYSQKSYRQKEVPMTNIKVPSFVEDLPY